MDILDKILPRINYVSDFGNQIIIPGEVVVKEESATNFINTNYCHITDVFKIKNPNVQYNNYTVFFIKESTTELQKHLHNISPTINNNAIDETYIIDIKATQLTVYASNNSGFFYALQTLRQIIKKSENISIPECIIADWPYKEFRAIHLYMPGENQIELFKRLIKTAASLKYNKLIIEVGAGMQFEKHPEINEAWERFVKEILVYPGKEEGIQTSQGYMKDSIHIALGDGSYISKKQVLDIINYARSHYIEVIPEVQSLSHCYYLLLPHKELAERYWDPWPDTYCPSNPKTYQLLFDVLDEVIEVFEPKTIHIGHDEAHTFKICPQCKDKDAAELFADDVKKIHNYLTSKGIACSMWSDMLTEVQTSWGFTGGGAKVMYDTVHNEEYHFHDTTNCIDLIPKDILMFNWMWWVSPEVQQKISGKGYNIVLGNFAGVDFKDWSTWGAHDYIKGAVIAAWCANKFEVLAHDGILFNIVYSINCLWNSNFTDENKNEYRILVSQLIPYIYNYLSGDELFCVDTSMDLTFEPLELKSNDSSDNASDEELGRLVFSKNNLSLKSSLIKSKVYINKSYSYSINIDKKVAAVRIIYYLDSKYDFLTSWAKDYDKFTEILAYISAKFDDLHTVTIPVKYGVNISNIQDEWGISTSKYYPFGPETVCYMAEPVFFNDNGIMKQIYCFTFKIPYPEKTLEKIDLSFVEEKGGLHIVGILYA